MHKSTSRGEIYANVRAQADMIVNDELDYRVLPPQDFATIVAAGMSSFSLNTSL